MESGENVGGVVKETTISNKTPVLISWENPVVIHCEAVCCVCVTVCNLGDGSLLNLPTQTRNVHVFLGWRGGGGRR